MVHLYIGNGKGKTTAALGLALRAWGFGKKVYVGQFLKDYAWPSGELKAAKKTGKCLVIERYKNQVHPMFRKGKDFDLKSLKRSLKKSLDKVNALVEKKKFEVVVLDEILNCLSGRFLAVEAVKEIVKKAKENKVELVLTGQDAPLSLKKLADYISFIKEEKHPFQRGVLAREGIDY